jgi:predicted nucleotidyltransferase
VGLIPTLRAALRPFAEKIACAFVYGSIARREEHATSDVDVMVVGNVGLGDLSPVLRRAEKRLGREVNVTNYSVDEFRKKVADEDHFLTSVLKGSLQFVNGGRNYSQITKFSYTKRRKRNWTNCVPSSVATSLMHRWTERRRTDASRRRTMQHFRLQKWRLHALVTASSALDTTGFLSTWLSSRLAKARTLQRLLRQMPAKAERD